MDQDKIINKVAYDLTMEYIRQNNILQCNQIEIGKKLRDIEMTYNEICIDLMNQTKFINNLAVCFEDNK